MYTLYGHEALQLLTDSYRGLGARATPSVLFLMDDIQFVYFIHRLLETMKNVQLAELINGRFAMIGIVAALGAYALTGQVIPGLWWPQPHHCW